jgi:hypothetical protein
MILSFQSIPTDIDNTLIITRCQEFVVFIYINLKQVDIYNPLSPVSFKEEK